MLDDSIMSSILKAALTIRSELYDGRRRRVMDVKSHPSKQLNRENKRRIPRVSSRVHQVTIYRQNHAATTDTLQISFASRARCPQIVDLARSRNGGLFRESPG